MVREPTLKRRDASWDSEIERPRDFNSEIIDDISVEFCIGSIGSGLFR